MADSSILPSSVQSDNEARAEYNLHAEEAACFTFFIAFLDLSAVDLSSLELWNGAMSINRGAIILVLDIYWVMAIRWR